MHGRIFSTLNLRKISSKHFSKMYKIQHTMHLKHYKGKHFDNIKIFISKMHQAWTYISSLIQAKKAITLCQSRFLKSKAHSQLAYCVLFIKLSKRGLYRHLARMSLNKKS